MGASCAVPKGTLTSPPPRRKPRGKKKEKESGGRRAETYPALLHQAGERQGAAWAGNRGFAFPLGASGGGN